MTRDLPKIAVVIPCYKVRNKVLDVINSVGQEVSNIYVVDDCCPEETGQYVKSHNIDNRVTVLLNTKNLGVGGAVKKGYCAALENDADIIVKLDGDGQMDPGLIKNIILPIADGEADYTKGNRFFDLEEIRVMPKTRLFGNAMLSLVNKLSSGYWHLFDPTNGYTAIHREALRHLPLNKISNRYFFESDMLFRLNILRAVVIDIPMDAKYGDEVSNLRISKILGEFVIKHIRNFGKRIFYNYYLRDMSLASIELPIGLITFLSGLLFGAYSWFISVKTGVPSSSGTVMLSALPIIIGLQFILAFLSFDISSTPTRPIHSLNHIRRMKTVMRGCHNDKRG